MGKYRITDNITGKVVTVSGDTAPTEQEAEQIFSDAGLRESATKMPLAQRVSKSIGADKMFVQKENSFLPTTRDIAPMTLGALGAFIGNIPGGVLGYAAGKNLNRAVGLDEQVSIPETARRTVMQDIPEGLAAEATGLVTGKSVGKLLEKAKNYAPNLYESALKPSTTLKKSVVDKRIGTALKEGIPVSEKGLEKSGKIIKNLNDEISSRIESASGVNLNQTITRDKALKPVGELSERVYKKDITPDTDMVKIAKYVDEVQTSQPELLTVPESQNFKKTINRQLDEYYKAVNKGKANPGAIEAKIKASMADGLREEMTNIFPELKKLNAREGSLIELNKSLGQAVNRIKNREIIPLISGVVLGTASTNAVIKAVLIKAVEHPTVKSNLAIALWKANPQGGFPIGSALLAKLGAYEAMNTQQENK